MKNTEARHFHIFTIKYPHEILASIDRLKARLIQEEDAAFFQLGLAWQVEKHSEIKNIVGKKEAKTFFNELVDKIWLKIKTWLEPIDRFSIILDAYKNLEALYQDKNQWSTTSRAQLALYNNALSVANKQHFERTQAILANRILIEMAVCTCCTSNGIQCSQSQMDTLLANISGLIHCAYISDAINYDIIKPEIKIYPNGTFDVDDAFFHEIVIPFNNSIFSSKFEQYSKIYDNLFQKNYFSQKQATETYSQKFINAFTDEYNISPDKVIDGFAELFDIANQQKQVVVEINYKLIIQYFTENRDFTQTEIYAFFNTFSLYPRHRWDNIPNGFNKRDWIPWRYRRQLSLVIRPLVFIDEPIESVRIIYGATQLAESIRYFFALIELAWLPTESLKKNGLTSQFIGSEAKKLGHDFEGEIVQLLKEQGWRCKPSVEMRSLGADNRLGEVDIFSFKDKNLLIIECKRLSPVSTMGEIGEMFRDFINKEFQKHINRCEWIEKNKKTVCNYLGISEEINLIPLLVSDDEIPLHFKKDLSKKILAKKDLPEWLSTFARSHM